MTQIAFARVPSIADRPGPAFPALEKVTRPMLTTEETAYYVNRKPQTLRTWACTEAGPLRPVRLHGRLGWPTDAVRRYLGVEATR